MRGLRGLLSGWMVLMAFGVSLPGVAAAGDAAEGTVRRPSLEEGFRQPPDSVKPWAYWWWLKGNVDEVVDHAATWRR